MPQAPPSPLTQASEPDCIAATSRPAPPRSTRISGTNAMAAAAAVATMAEGGVCTPEVAAPSTEGASSARLVPVILSSLRSVAASGLPRPPAATPLSAALDAGKEQEAAVACPSAELTAPPQHAVTTITLRVPPGPPPLPFLGLHLSKAPSSSLCGGAAGALVVLAVDPAGPAAAGGVRPGDRLVGLGDWEAEGGSGAAALVCCDEVEEQQLRDRILAVLGSGAGLTMRFERP